MSIAHQLTTKKTLVNLDYNGDIVDICWPDKGVYNLLLRSKIYNIYYLDGEKIVPEFSTVAKFNDNGLTAIYTATINSSFTIKIKYELFEDHLTQEITLLNSNAKEQKLDIFVIAQPDFGSNYSRDTAIYYPYIEGIVHYESDHYLGIFSAEHPRQFTCQSGDDFNGRGAKPDRELTLSNNPVTVGKVESALNYTLELAAKETKVMNVYYALGRNYTDIENLQTKLVRMPSSKAPIDPIFPKQALSLVTRKAEHLAEELQLDRTETEKLIHLAQISKYLVNGSFNETGGVFAAVDSTFFKEGGVDDYSYFWPRDGALIMLADLYSSEQVYVERYFKFFSYVAKCLGEKPYLLHRYRVDNAALASSWHSWIDYKNNLRTPIQIDETALTLYAYGKFFRTGRQQMPEFHAKIFSVMDFLLRNIDEDGLHSACFDPWENHWGHFFSTQVSIIAALKEMRNLLEYENQFLSEKTSLSTSKITEKIDQATAKLQSFFVSEKGYFTRGKIKDDYGNWYSDESFDSTLHWAWMFDVLPISNELLQKSLALAETKLEVAGGSARYENDHYLKGVGNVTGNPWYISTLWFCQYYLKTRQLAKAKKYLNFILEHMDYTGLLPEMADPKTGISLSVKPLIWSHAALLNLLNL